jgi:hypothetical protein
MAGLVVNNTERIIRENGPDTIRNKYFEKNVPKAKSQDGEIDFNLLPDRINPVKIRILPGALWILYCLPISRMNCK